MLAIKRVTFDAASGRTGSNFCLMLSAVLCENKETKFDETGIKKIIFNVSFATTKHRLIAFGPKKNCNVREHGQPINT